ncbi:MAG: hypothetical protein OXC25_14765 [Thiotrichales bacterium]|nr:hypothetical protein [Thiotrichales bacterium]MCY4351102.1 hypothetical protein [Thiotrichales bacterium]
MSTSLTVCDIDPGDKSWLRREPRVAAWLDSIADDGLGLASITVWEVLRCRAPYRSLEGLGLCSISIPLGVLR